MCYIPQSTVVNIGSAASPANEPDGAQFSFPTSSPGSAAPTVSRLLGLTQDTPSESSHIRKTVLTPEK